MLSPLLPHSITLALNIMQDAIPTKIGIDDNEKETEILIIQISSIQLYSEHYCYLLPFR